MMTAGGQDGAAQRPDSDDYDLLTFGEVAARLAEEVTLETAELERVRRADPPDPAEVRRIEERIALLKLSGDRYRKQETSSESFTRRFGSVLRPAAGPRPRWS